MDNLKRRLKKLQKIKKQGDGITHSIVVPLGKVKEKVLEEYFSRYPGVKEAGNYIVIISSIPEPLPLPPELQITD